MFFEFWCYMKGYIQGKHILPEAKMERFVIIVNGWKLLTIITKPSILDVVVALDPPLPSLYNLKAHFLFYISH